MALIHYDEAVAAAEKIKDPITNQLVMQALALAVQRDVANKGGLGDFDLLVFVDLLAELMSRHNVLRRILAGEDLRLF